MCMNKSLLTPAQSLWKPKYTLEVSAVDKVQKEKAEILCARQSQDFLLGWLHFSPQISGNLQEIIKKHPRLNLNQNGYFRKN